MLTRCLALALWLASLAAFSAAEQPAIAAPIPPLDTKGDIYKTEGENDPLIYSPAIGKKKAIMLYVDFPDRPQTVDTKERGRGVLGDGLFQQLFHDQSYGKLEIEIEHVHGWRRLPKERKQYGTKETDPHRDLFVDIFKLYPEVDFREYDYIMAKMSGLGNTAFGERDDKAIPYRGEKINVALNIGSNSPYVLAHETGHLMGLPDLYTYGGVEGPRNPAGPWDIMSGAGRATGFLGWHRHKLKWLDAERKAYLTEGKHTVELTPLSANRGVSMIVVPADNPKSPCKVFVIEVAQAIRLRGGERTEPKGVLIYSVDATLPTGNNPVVVYPREDMTNAAFHPDDQFEDEDAPMTVRVIARNENGSYRVTIDVKPQKD